MMYIQLCRVLDDGECLNSLPFSHFHLLKDETLIMVLAVDHRMLKSDRHYLGGARHCRAKRPANLQIQLLMGS